MFIGHQIRLDPNNKQRTYFAKACGVSRFAYNWALDQWNKLNDANEKASFTKLNKQLNAIKRAEFPWMLEVTKCAPQIAIKNLEVSFKRYFSKVSEHPKFKKKGHKDSFSMSNDVFYVKGKKIYIPRLGYVKMTEELRFNGKIIGAVIRRIADQWYVSIRVEMPDPEPIHNSESQAVGVDLGVKELATLDDGTKIHGTKPHKASLARLRHLEKSLCRKVGAKNGEKKSKNFLKAKKKLARLHRRIFNIRNDETHKLTSMLTQKYGVIGVEDLNVSDMIKNHTLARAVADMSFFEFRRQLEYKSKITGSTIIVADRFFPSSKQCCVCGEKFSELTLNMREWTCPNCHTRHDRDINAAINLRNLAVSTVIETHEK